MNRLADRAPQPGPRRPRLRTGGKRLALGLATLLLAATSSCSRPPAHPDEPAIRAFLARYFETWSRRDMEGYGACFDPQARILYLAADGGVVSEGTVDFLHGQRLGHERSAVPMTERPLEMRITGDARVAQASVTWILTQGAREERGADFFTLRRSGDGWKIVSLVFYGE